MQRPAVVVVVGALLAIGVPAVTAVQRLVHRETTLDVVQRPRSTDGLEECLDHDLEPDPVDRRVLLTDHGRQPRDDALAVEIAQPVPQPGLGQVQSERDRAGLHLRLAELVRSRPGVRRRGIRPGPQPVGVPLGEVVRIVAVLPFQPDRQQQKGSGERLEGVAVAAVGAARSRQLDPGMVGRGPGLQRQQQPVGDRAPGIAGQAGEGGVGHGWDPRVRVSWKFVRASMIRRCTEGPQTADSSSSSTTRCSSRPLPRPASQLS